MANEKCMDWKNLLNPIRFKAGSPMDAASSELRSDFERDYDRIIFSGPFRRLQDKTQVFPLPEEGFVHNRLTHSLEVASVARSLGRNVGKELSSRHPYLQINATDVGAITSAAALCHDIGNPPFGHAGEEAISDFFKHDVAAQEFRGYMNDAEWTDLTKFEGNAQGFRLLMREEGQGLRLTIPTLAAFSKYPKPVNIQGIKGRKSQKKYGFFQTEKEAFTQLANSIGLLELEGSWVRHPLTFLVEAADDICYHLMDLEDGFNMGLISYEVTRDLMAALLKEDYRPAKLDQYPGAKERIGVLRALAIGKLIEECSNKFLELENELLEGTFDQALTDVIPSADTLKKISKLSVEEIYRSKPVLGREASGFEVLSGLISRFSRAVFHKHFAPDRLHAQDKVIFRLLPENAKWQLEQENVNLYSALRIVIDVVSGMTDKEALIRYRTIFGIPLR
jgi:dGTPase